MKQLLSALSVLSLLAGCGQSAAPAAKPTLGTTLDTKPSRPPAQNLVEARKGFKTKLTEQGGTREPPPTPPQNLFRLVHYPSPVGELAAYLTPDPGEGKKSPAIIWLRGGDCNSLGNVWDEQPERNDQTARQYRREGIIMMFPSLRGGNQNPGRKEGFLGEVDDVLAARDFLAKQPYVDPGRIYLGGHSTGGTLALLVAECSDQFRAVFSFGPRSDVSSYPPALLPFDRAERDEVEIRSPIHWLGSVRTPTFVFEGAMQGNVDSLVEILGRPNPNVQCFVLQSGNHFNILAPVNRVLAKKILEDKGPKTNLQITVRELEREMR